MSGDVDPALRYRTEQIAVPFAGPGAGTGELSWGQREIWATCELLGRSLAMGGVMPMPAEASLGQVRATLGCAVSRHPALRTRFRCDEGGRPVQQVVAGSGEAMLDIFDVPDAVDAAAYADEVSLYYELAQYDYEHEWPIRMAVVRQGGAITHTVVMYCHLVIDGFGLDALTRDLLSLGLSGADTPEVLPPPPEALSALDQVRQQTSPSGQRQTESAMRQWRRLLQGCPSQRSRHRTPAPLTHGKPRYWQGTMHSPAMYQALATITARTQVESSPVLLAAYAVALARVSGNNPSVVRAVMSNRFRPGFAESVSVVNQTGLCVIDVAGATFDEVVQRAWRSSMGAGMQAYYDPRALQDLIVGVGEERGEPLDLSCFFNDTRRTRGVGAVTPTEGSLREVLARSWFRWDLAEDSPRERIFLNIEEVPAGEAIQFWLGIDTCYWPPEEAQECARQMEAVLVRAAFDPNAPAGVGG